jgi:cytochrome c oxidase assembly factor CtaG
MAVRVCEVTPAPARGGAGLLSPADVWPPRPRLGGVSPFLGPADVAQLEPLTGSRLLTGWSLDPVMAALLLAVGATYLYGVWVLRRRGDAWSWPRTFSFLVLGLGSAAVATQSALGAYDTVLLSVHMAQHMILSMVAPVFLALGAPVTLALRTLTRTPRGWLLSVLHSRVAAVLAFPPVAFTLYVLSPWALYLTGWYEATLQSTYLHEMLHIHFLVVGSLFFWPLLGVDPVPGRVAYPFRMLTVFATLPFHAFLGVTVMGMTTLIAGDWYTSLNRGWGPTPAEDQELAGGLLWGSGDVVGLVIFGVLFVQWVRQSQREAAREDRRLDRLDAARARAGDAERQPGYR